MSQYISSTPAEQAAMLADIGLQSMADLFSDIPAEVRLQHPLHLPEALSEMELIQHLQTLAGKNDHLGEYACFLGAGAYDHFIPRAIDHLISRQEFYTAYTPYQPEISQGTLQAIFEYQTLICELTGMAVANASMYDGASACAEAVMMACTATKKSEILVSRAVHPESRAVIDTYCRCNGLKIVVFGCQNGQSDLADLERKISAQTAAVMMQNPNFFGAIEPLETAAEIAHRHQALLVASVDPISLAILKSPGAMGADIVVGEGQGLGNPLNFGGPYLGFFATTDKLLRKIPGRIVGQTQDKNGRRGFVLTLQTREQHIRREKATSNICSNEALCALSATIYLTLMGRAGLKEAAMLCLQKAHYACDQLISTGSFSAPFDAPFFKEFVVISRKPVDELNRQLRQDKIIGGYALGRDYPELANGWLIAVTEKRSKSEIDRMVELAGRK